MGNDMGIEHTEREVEGREAEGRERYYSCSSIIEEEEELDDKITKKKKRNKNENLRINLLRAKSMNEKNESMIQVRRTYVKKDEKNNETINPTINIEDEERKDEEEVENEGEVDERNIADEKRKEVAKEGEEEEK